MSTITSELLELADHIRQQRRSAEVFVHTLAAEHAAGEHVIPQYQTCPGCIIERAKHRPAA